MSSLQNDTTTIRVSATTKAKIVRIASEWRRTIQATVDLLADAHLQSSETSPRTGSKVRRGKRVG